MRPLCSPALALLVGWLAYAPPDDLKRLQGEWEIVASEVDGKPVGFSPKTRIVFEGDRRRTIYDGQILAEFSVKLDAEKDPNWIDLKVEKSVIPALVGDTMLGIYRIDGDTLEVCDAFAGGERPSEFRSKTKKYSYTKFRRVGAKTHE